MQTTIETIQQNKQRDYERFEENRRHEIATDLSERIGFPLNHVIEYQMIEGAAYCLTDTKHRPFHDQTAQALNEGKTKYQGVNEFEYIRLGLEHDEAIQLDAFGRGELNGNVLIKFSRVPDAVFNGTAQIRGYRTDHMRSFGRIYYREEGLVKCHLFSIDGNDPDGMAQLGELIGINMGHGRGSEDILADHSLMQLTHVSSEGINQLIQKAVNEYDAKIHEKSGRRTYAGSHFLNQRDALSVVKGHPELLNQHMRAISSIMSKALNQSEKENLLEVELKRTAAAITITQEGGAIASSSDAAVDARMQTGNFDRDCPTGTSMNAAEQMGMNQGKTREEFKDGECRACLKKTKVGECSVCQSCEDADNHGTDLNLVRLKALRQKVTDKQELDTQKKEKNPQTMQRMVSKQALILAQYGEYAQVKKEKGVGTEYIIVFDRRSGTEVARL